jgi:hypothetical protein
MEHKPYIVLGEAPESDSEEEVNVPVVSILRIISAIFIYLILHYASLNMAVIHFSAVGLLYHSWMQN